MSPRILFTLAAAMAVGPVSSVQAQQVGVGGSLAPASHSFHENFGITWGMRGNGWFFNSGGLPPIPFGLGGGGGASFGGGFGGGGLNGGFQILAQQGSDTTLGSTSPSVTVMNGATGYFSDTTIRPFVTGLVPVVGNMPSAPPIPLAMPQQAHPLAERLGRLQAGGAPPLRHPVGEDPAAEAPERGIVLGGGGPRGGPSSAERGDLSVAEIKARKAATETTPDAEIASYIEKAKALEADGKPSVARIYYQMAARRATGDERTAIVEKLRQLEAAK
jgi:hypothetical protein